MYASSRVSHCVKNYCLHVSWKQIPKENQCIELWRTISRKKSIPLTNIISCATDGAPSMVGRHREFPSYLKIAVPKVLTVHCVIHRQHLVTKNLSEKLHESLSTVITAVNKIKANALNSRLFHQLYIENDEDFQCLLFHTEVKWLYGDLRINNKTPNRMLTRRLPHTKCINASPRIRLHASIRLKKIRKKEK